MGLQALGDPDGQPHHFMEARPGEVVFLFYRVLLILSGPSGLPFYLGSRKKEKSDAS